MELSSLIPNAHFGLSPQSFSQKKFLIFFPKKTRTEKTFFLKRKLFLYFWKWNPAVFTPGSKNEKNPP